MQFEMRPESSALHRIAERMWRLITRRDVDLIEIYSAMLFLGWGTQLVLPWDTFTSSLSYDAMSVLLPEKAWGVFLGGIGVTQFTAYSLNLWRTRLVTALIACMTWAFIGVLFGYSNVQGVGWIVYAFLALTSALVFWRILSHRIAHD